MFDSDLESIEEEEEAQNEVIPPRVDYSAHARRDQKRASRGRQSRYQFAEDADGAIFQHRKNMGAKKKQRVDTLRLIASYADPDDVRYDARDLLEETMTAFTRLLKDEEGMRMWNEFIEKDEKEQKRILSKIDREGKVKSDGGGSKKTEKKRSAKGDNLRARKGCEETIFI